MPEQVLEFKVIFDADTQDFKVIKKEVDDIAKKTDAVGKSAKKTQGSFGKLADTVGKLGVAAFFTNIIFQALKSQKSFEQFQTTVENTANDLFNELGPALELVFNGLSGLVRVVGVAAKALKDVFGTAIKAIQAAIKKDFGGALDIIKEGLVSIGDDIEKGLIEAGTRAQGIVQESLKGQAEIIQKEAENRIRNIELTNAQRVEILKKAEAEINELARTAAEFRNLTENEREKKRLELINTLGSQRVGLQQAIIQDEIAADKIRTDQSIENAEARRDARLEDISQELEDERTRGEQRAELIAERVALELATAEENFKLRRDQLEQAIEEDNNVTEAKKAELNALEEDLENERTSILAKGMKDREKIRDKERKSTEAFFASIIKAGASAGSQQIQQTGKVGDALRAAGAAQIKTIADQAAASIAITGAAAAGRVFLSTPGLIFTRLAAAAGTIAFYTGLAATVSAVGGVAAKAIAPGGGGGGGGGGGDTGETGDVSTTAAGGGGGGAALGAPPTDGPGPQVTVIFEGPVLAREEEIARSIAEETAKQARS